MTTRTAVCRKAGEPWEITELELDDPLAGEVLVKFHAPLRRGQLKLDELVTRKYALDEIKQGYQDMHDGKNIRGVIIHEY